MIKFITIQKASKEIGISPSLIQTMIKNKDLTIYKKEGYKRVFLSVEEINNSIKPVGNEDINLDNFLI